MEVIVENPTYFLGLLQEIIRQLIVGKSESKKDSFLQLVMKDGIVGFKELAGLEELLPIAVGGGISGTGPLPWVVGGIVAGGIGAATGGSSGSDTAKNQKFLKRLALKLRMIKIMMAFSTNKNLQDYQQ